LIKETTCKWCGETRYGEEIWHEEFCNEECESLQERYEFKESSIKPFITKVNKFIKENQIHEIPFTSLPHKVTLEMRELLLEAHNLLKWS